MANVRPTNRGTQKPQPKKQEAQKEEAPQQTWNQFSGVCRVFGQTFEGQDSIAYSVSVAHKESDGSYINSYIKCRFAKSAGEPGVEGEAFIDIKNAFLTAGKNNRIVMVITEWDGVE